MEQKKECWIITGVLCIMPILAYYYSGYSRKEEQKVFIADTYYYILKVKPSKNEGSRGFYIYPCIDLDSNSHWYKKTFNLGMHDSDFYNSVVVGDTIEKKKGDSFILLKREHLILKIHYTFSVKYPIINNLCYFL